MTKLKRPSPSKNRLLSVLAKILLFIIIGAFAALFFFFGRECLRSYQHLEHYRRVYQNPVTVHATITRHVVDRDSDGDTYYSLMTYVVNGTRYEDIRYEAENEPELLTSIGTPVTIKVSPEDPSWTLDELARKKGSALVLLIMVICLPLLLVLEFLQYLLRSKEIPHTTDYDIIHKDARVVILTRIGWWSFGMLALIFGAHALRYPMLTGTGHYCFLAAWILAVLYYTVITIRDLHRVKDDNYELRREYLVDKSESSDSDGGTNYYLHYQSNGKTWSCSVSHSKYNNASIGEEILSLYLPNGKNLCSIMTKIK